MKNIHYSWHQRFRELYDKALVKYRNEHRGVATFFTTREVGVLATIGAKPMELFDYAEDSSDLDPETDSQTPLDARIIRQLGVAGYAESKLQPALQARLKQFRLTAEGSGVLR